MSFNRETSGIADAATHLLRNEYAKQCPNRIDCAVE
ncbi:hypothetical protein PHLH3_16020 [Pseudomonas sp. St386]|nr:hypothetical protein PFLU4_04220 [Pseudomonas fluorescens]RDI06055.1 hypothetical protein DFO59_103213 [Pseudomonas fluorescens]BBP51976.1 hypothetical protein PHLH3_16020 [Pseudomonas sp. St386]SDQ01001.1 hypothetical protein SAMN04490180_6268 [Pseudomonas brassicacearum]